MSALALTAPLVALLLMLTLQRMEGWLLKTTASRVRRLAPRRTRL